MGSIPQIINRDLSIAMSPLSTMLATFLNSLSTNPHTLLKHSSRFTGNSSLSSSTLPVSPIPDLIQEKKKIHTHTHTHTHTYAWTKPLLIYLVF